MNPLYIGVGAVGILALILAGTSSTAQAKPNPEKRRDDTRKDMPPNDPSQDEPVTTDMDVVLEWRQTPPDPVAPPAAPSKQPIDPPNYGVPPGTYSVEVFKTPFDVRNFFWAFGYIPESAVNDTPMNDLGPDRKLGGGDDKSNEIVRDFQADYNAVVRHNEQGDIWGLLDEDGLVGPHTLNALLHAREQALAGGRSDEQIADWWAELVSLALEPPTTETQEGPIDG